MEQVHHLITYNEKSPDNAYPLVQIASVVTSPSRRKQSTPHLFRSPDQLSSHQIVQVNRPAFHRSHFLKKWITLRHERSVMWLTTYPFHRAPNLMLNQWRSTNDYRMYE